MDKTVLSICAFVVIATFCHIDISCNQKNDIEMKEKKIRTEAVSIQEDHNDLIPDPPPNQIPTTPFHTLSEWLTHICTAESPSDSVTSFLFGVFHYVATDKYVLHWEGSRHIAQGQQLNAHDFIPTNRYFLLPEREFGGLSVQQTNEKLTSQLKQFTTTSEFSHSFFAKAKSIRLDFSGEIIYSSR